MEVESTASSYKTAIEIIEEERLSQINDHGYTKEFHLKHPEYYKEGEMYQAALFCFDPNLYPWPDNWQVSARDKITQKNQVQRLACAGAFFLAEEERTGLSNQDEINIVIKQINLHRSLETIFKQTADASSKTL